MSGASPRPSVRTAVLNGMQKAYSSYQKMSGDSWPMTPEFFIATYVAKELKKTADPCLVTLEANIKNTLTAAGAQRPGPSASASR